MNIYIIIIFVIVLDLLFFIKSKTTFLFADRPGWGGQTFPLFANNITVTQEEDPGNNPQPCESTRVWYEGCDKDGNGKWNCTKFYCNRPGFCKTCQSGLGNSNRNDCVRCSDLSDNTKWPYPPDRNAWFSAVYNAETTPFTSDTNIPLIGPWSYIN